MDSNNNPSPGQGNYMSEWARALWSSDLSTTQKAVAHAIGMHADFDTGAGAWPSNDTLSKVSSCSVRTVSRTRQELADLGWIQIDGHRSRAVMCSCIIPKVDTGSTFNMDTGSTYATRSSYDEPKVDTGSSYIPDTGSTYATRSTLDGSCVHQPTHIPTQEQQQAARETELKSSEMVEEDTPEWMQGALYDFLHARWPEHQGLLLLVERVSYWAAHMIVEHGVRRREVVRWFEHNMLELMAREGESRPRTINTAVKWTLDDQRALKTIESWRTAPKQKRPQAITLAEQRTEQERRASAYTDAEHSAGLELVRQQIERQKKEMSR